MSDKRKLRLLSQTIEQAFAEASDEMENMKSGSDPKSCAQFLYRLIKDLQESAQSIDDVLASSIEDEGRGIYKFQIDENVRVVRRGFFATYQDFAKENGYPDAAQSRPYHEPAIGDVGVVLVRGKHAYFSETPSSSLSRSIEKFGFNLYELPIYIIEVGEKRYIVSEHALEFE